MFLVTTLLNEVIAWMRAQPGTSSLRALLYMDEVFGYFPPTANPPSKTPMLTLLKQARAFGLGIVLATQNPVDLDYKGLSNAGTWWLGRLQTERDKARVLDGLEGASSSAGRTFDRARMEAVLSGLGNRVFLMNNVHDDAPVVFQSRWALSYLRGPLTRAQIETLMQPRKQASAAAGDAAAATSTREQPVSELGQRPVVPPGIDELFLSPRGSASGGAKIVYRPALFGSARVHFVKTGSAVDTWESVALLAPTSESPGENPWAEADPLSEERRVFSPQPLSNADFASLPSELTRPKNYAAWKTALKNHVYEQQILKSYACPTLKEQSKPGESEADFRVRIRQRAAENRDLEVEKLRKKYAPKLLNLNERIRKSQQHVEREQSQVTQQTLQTALSVGTTVLGALFGRKLTSTSNVTRAASTMRQAGRTARERGDVQQARENVESLQQQLTELEESLEREISTLQETLAPDAVQITESVVRARKSDLIVERVALAWTPWRVDSSGIAEPA
jgi:hypothetical protein